MGELMQQYIDEAEQDLLHTYNRYQVVLDRGDGVSLYDIEGKRYLDFVAGIAVFALGYHNAEYNDALKAQIRQGHPHLELLLQCSCGGSGKTSEKGFPDGPRVLHQQRCGGN